jgi:hypothetical protein
MFELGEEGYRGTVEGIKVYALSKSSFLARASRLRKSSIPFDFRYLGTQIEVSWNKRGRVPHKGLKLTEALFRFEFLAGFEQCVCAIDNGKGTIKEFFIVCDEDGADSKKCIRYLLADFLVWCFEGMNLTDAEMDFVELLATHIRDKYGLGLGLELEKLERYRVDSHTIIWRGGKKSALIVKIYRMEKVNGVTEIDSPMMYVFYDFETKKAFIYPRINVEFLGEIAAEVVAKIC